MTKYIASTHTDHYHYDKNCKWLTQGNDILKAAPEQVDSRESCAHCSPDKEPNKNNNPHKTCRLCGETYQRARYHFPCND